MTYRKPPRRPRYHYRPNDKGHHHCRVHIGCGHNGRVASRWYWRHCGIPYFAPFDETKPLMDQKPVSDAVLCCEGCQIEIWERFERSFMLVG